jgi:putative spermidine/putrescine transport system substrate-binding protein
MTELRIARRRLLQGVAVGSAALALGWPGRGRAAEQIVESGWGGEYQFKDQFKAFVEPFMKETGIKVVQVASPGNAVGLIKAQVENKNPEWDIVEVTQTEALRLKNQGLLALIRYADDVKADLPEEILDDYVAPRIYTAQVLAWNSKVFPGDAHPKSWADLWDIKRFPGPRIAAGWFPYDNVEIGLMADGVPKDQVYPLDDSKVERGLAKLRELRPHMHVWYNAGAQSVQLFADQEVVLGVIYENRAREIQKAGHPIDWTLDGGILEQGCYVIPAGSRHVEAATALANTALRRSSQVALVKINQYGAVNPKAYDELAEPEKERNIGYPANVAKELRLQVSYWVEAMPKYAEAWEALKAGQ